MSRYEAMTGNRVDGTLENTRLTKMQVAGPPGDCKPGVIRGAAIR